VKLARRPILLYHPDRLFVERMRRACAQRYHLSLMGSWQDLMTAAEAIPPHALVVVDPYEPGPRGETLSPTLQFLLGEFPSLTVLAALAVHPSAYEDLRMLGEWGITRVIVLDEEDTPTAIAMRLETATGRRLRYLVRQTLSDQNGRAHAILAAASRTVVDAGGAADLARSLHVTTRTLLRWCRAAGLPAPRRLLAWLRILLAAELLDDPGRSIMGVALACGYSSDATLRQALKSFVGTTPKFLRREGAFAVVSKAFAADVKGR
jgi:AraC-like DNA-binding protein